MSIRKITEEEILTYGVKHLSTRPNTPSLYEGKPLSAEELKDAFDKLPRLIAERFNDLLTATGLFGENADACYDSFAEVIETKLSPSHSLAQFFEDVKNGTLSSYLTLPDDEKLADAISSMKSEILALQNTSATAVAERVLAEAKAYADTPRGTVSSRSTLPVSGKTVYQAINKIETELDPEGLSERLKVLENAATDTVYAYPTVDTTLPYTRASKDVLANAALCRMGGITFHDKNLFSEKILTTHTGSNLTFTWDEAANCLVLNGTLTPQEKRVPLAVFRESSMEALYSTALFYHGGTIAGLAEGKTNFVFTTEEGGEITFSLRQSDHIDLNMFHEDVFGRFSSIEIETETTVTFHDFRFNLMLKAGYANALTYTPFENRVPKIGFPKELHVLGANEWHEEPDFEFGTSIEIPLSFSTPCYYVNCSCRLETEDSSIRNIYIEAITENGTGNSVRRSPGVATQALLSSSEEPILGIRIRTTIKDENYPYRTRVRNFFVERIPSLFLEESPYSEPFEYTLTFPESLCRFQDKFFGFDANDCNHFNFERGVFTSKTNKFTVDGSLDWQEDSDVPGRYHASFTAPSNAPNKPFCPSALFDASESEDMSDESIYYTANTISLQSALFSSSAAVKAFFTIHPIDIIYEITATTEFLTEEEIAALQTPVLPVAPGAHIYLTDAQGELFPAFLRIKYQTKLQKE